MPPNFRVVSVRSWLNGSKISPIRSVAMPIPVSLTENRSDTELAARDSTATASSTEPCSVNLIAFPTRLNRTWFSRTGSPTSPGGTAGSTAATSASFFCSAPNLSAPATPCTRVRGSNSTDSNCTLPDSILLMSRMSLIVESSWSAEKRTASR